MNILYLSIIVAGFGGGFVRGLIGYLKYQYSYKNVPFNLPYFFNTMFLSGIIGLLVAVAIDSSSLEISGIDHISPALAFIIGYAGGDFLDSVYKIISKNIKVKK